MGHPHVLFGQWRKNRESKSTGRNACATTRAPRAGRETGVPGKGNPKMDAYPSKLRASSVRYTNKAGYIGEGAGNKMDWTPLRE
jgi:hypothetical protein